MPTKPYRNTLSVANRFLRALWNLTYWLLFRLSPAPLHAWRRFILRLFGASIAKGAHVYPTARIWAPWNLEMAEHSCLAGDAICYCVARVTLGAHSLVSQYSFLCTASHDYESEEFMLTSKPIVIGPRAWVAADVFIGPGVEIGEGAIIGARSTALTSVPAWEVHAGSPTRLIKKRVMRPNVG